MKQSLKRRATGFSLTRSPEYQDYSQVAAVRITEKSNVVQNWYASIVELIDSKPEWSCKPSVGLGGENITSPKELKQGLPRHFLSNFFTTADISQLTVATVAISNLQLVSDPLVQPQMLEIVGLRSNKSLTCKMRLLKSPQVLF